MRESAIRDCCKRISKLKYRY